MRRVFESIWWIAGASVLLVIYGGTFPSDPKAEPGMNVFAHTVLAGGIVMLLLALGSWVMRSMRRRR